MVQGVVFQGQLPHFDLHILHDLVILLGRLILPRALLSCVFETDSLSVEC